MRVWSNWIFCICVFAAVIFLLWRFCPDWALLVGGGAAIFFLYFFLFNFLEGRAIWIKCDQCGQKITSKTPWVCGFEKCKKPNQNVERFPFLNKCEHCGAEPKAYQCHHCGKTIFLTQDLQIEGFAFAIGSKFQTKPTSPEPVKDEIAERKHATEIVKAQIESLQREAELVEAQAHLKKVKGEKTSLEEDGDAKHLIHMGRLIVSRQKIARAKEELKDDPEALERTIKFWEGWKDKLSL